VGRRRGRLTAACALAVAPVLGGCAGADVRAAPYAASAFPTGAPVSVADLEADAVVLAAWATWCLPCERELPLLDAYARTAPAGLAVVAVNVDTATVDDAQVADMLERLDVALPVWRDPSGAMVTRFGTGLMPFTVLLDGDGGVVATWSGAVDPEDEAFREAVADALA
jgi:thiol-disulfide isomerase/thioredoxin